MRTRSALLTGLATVGLVTSGVVIGQQASADGGSNLKVHEKFTNIKFLGANEFGQHVPFTTEVTKPGGGKLGIGIGDCTRMSGDSETKGTFHCSQTYHLNGGDIFAGGFYDLAEKTCNWSILGGTGKYRNAKGEEDFTTSDGQNFADTFRFG